MTLLGPIRPNSKTNQLEIACLRGQWFISATLLGGLTVSDARRRRWNGNIAQLLANEFNTTQKVIRADARFAKALAVITRNCGEQARELILSARAPLTAKQVGVISRTTPERQRFEMEQVAQGRRPFCKPENGVPIFDTLHYGEVVSRLRRASGLVRQQEKIVRAYPVKSVYDVPKIEKVLRRISTNARKVASALGISLRRPRAFKDGGAVQTRKRMCRRVYTLLAAANGLIEKNARDIPRLPKSNQATETQKQIIQQHLSEIIEHSEALRRFLALFER